MSNKLKINTRDEYLRDILSNGKYYYVPKFQRDYSWTSDQLEDLWEDILQLEETDYHYMGYLVLQETEDGIKIIDGQQRITTFSFIVLAAVKRLREMEDNERADEIFRNYIRTKDVETLAEKNKLKLNKNNNYYYSEVVDGLNISARGKGESVGLMKKATDYFYEEFKGKTGEEIGFLIKAASLNLLFTTIYIGDEINAYKVFETLNARGVQLSSADLLKNYIFSMIDRNDDIPTDKVEELEGRWQAIGEAAGDAGYSDYILAQWNSCHTFTRKASLFKAIRSEINNKELAEQYIRTLTQQSELYRALGDGNDEYWKDYPENINISKDLNFLKLFGIRQTKSLLLISLVKHPEHFYKILKWVKVLSLRYNVICRGHTTEQEKLYNKICLGIAQDCPLETIKEQFLSLYPKDEKFKQDFADKTMQPTNQGNKRAKYLLACLHNHHFNASISEAEYSVEHILPLNPSQEWIELFGDSWQLFIQRLGNMALVSEKINQKLGQEEFSVKKSILSNAKSQTVYIDDYPEWNSQAVEARQKKLAELAATVWRID